MSTAVENNPRRIPVMIPRWFGFDRRRQNRDNIPTGYASLSGEHFRIGRAWYPGVGERMYAMHNKTVQSESSLSGGMLHLSPPVVTHRGITTKAIQNGARESQARAYDRARIPIPLIVRR